MKIFQRFIQLYLFFGAINIIHSAGNCYCYEDCDALTDVINKQNQQRRQPSPDKKFLHNAADTSTCKRNTKCCVQATPVCRDGWTMHEKRCFMFVKCRGKCSTNEARNSCMGKKSRLAKVSSSSHEQLFIRMLNTSIWILFGGSDQDTEGTWRWPDGSLFDDGYTNWQLGQPDGKSHQNCVALWVSVKKWTDESCSGKYSTSVNPGYVCETSPTFH